jgi:hypothetical protein
MVYDDADTQAELIDPPIHKRGWTEGMVRSDSERASRSLGRDTSEMCPIRGRPSTGIYTVSEKRLASRMDKIT